MNQDYSYVQRVYNPKAEYGRGVVIDGKPGIIVQSRGNYIGVVLDEDKPNCIKTFHPECMVVYGEMRTPRKITRSQKRYLSFLEVADCFLNFKAYLKYLSQKSGRVEK